VFSRSPHVRASSHKNTHHGVISRGVQDVKCLEGTRLLERTLEVRDKSRLLHGGIARLKERDGVYL